MLDVPMPEDVTHAHCGHAHCDQACVGFKKTPGVFRLALRKSERAPMQTHEVENSYGSVLVSINFCSWIYPLATASMPASTT